MISKGDNSCIIPKEKQKGLSIVMPCLNEEKTVGRCIDKAIDFLHRYGIDGEVIVADNGSIDCSIAIAEEKNAKVIKVEQRGYGAALRAGIMAANYDWIIMGDADDSYDFSDLTEFISKLEEGYDLVMGNRFRGVLNQVR